jgi:PhnB protein
MNGKTQYTPKGFHSITPYLFVNNGAQAIEFYKTVFAALEKVRIPGANGKIGYCELRIGDSPLMLSDEYPEMNIRGPKALGGSPVGIYIYVEDPDLVVEKALKAGATLDRPVQDQFFGDRMGAITDPFGHMWYIGKQIEELTPEQVMQRMAKHSHGA